MIKKVLLIGSIALSMQSNASQQQDIEKLVAEINYLMEVTQTLQSKHKKDRSQIRFNYEALLMQLNTAKQRSIEYLNRNIDELHFNPPITVKQSLTRE